MVSLENRVKLTTCPGPPLELRFRSYHHYTVDFELERMSFRFDEDSGTTG